MGPRGANDSQRRPIKWEWPDKIIISGENKEWESNDSQRRPIKWEWPDKDNPKEVSRRQRHQGMGREQGIPKDIKEWEENKGAPGTKMTNKRPIKGENRTKRGWPLKRLKGIRWPLKKEKYKRDGRRMEIVNRNEKWLDKGEEIWERIWILEWMEIVVMIIIIIVMILLSVALMTIGERKWMGSIQRRVGRNKIGKKGLLQAIGDGLKLILKEMIIPVGSNKWILYSSPIIMLILSLYRYVYIVWGKGISISEDKIGILKILAIMGIMTYSVLLGGWSGNSKYSLMGGLRSTAQMISYEVGLGLTIIIIIMLSNSYNIHEIILSQKAILNIIPLLGLGIILIIIGIAETNRAPFDLPEAESELTAGFMTEHSGGIFAYYFLAEYTSMILMSSLITILLFGGYIININILNNNIINGLILGIKVTFILIIFIWVRGTYPRLRYDQLIELFWKKILPIILGYSVIVPSLI